MKKIYLLGMLTLAPFHFSLAANQQKIVVTTALAAAYTTFICGMTFAYQYCDIKSGITPAKEKCLEDRITNAQQLWLCMMAIPIGLTAALIYN